MKNFIRNLAGHRNFYMWACIALILVRTVLIIFMPLMDKTEARYAEIARIMAETGNWIAPQIDYGVAWWAKPVLSTWLSAISLKGFGDNEFAARLPSLVLSILMVIMVNRFARRENLPVYFTGFVIISLPEFLLHMGVVSTDVTLAFSVMLIMLSFWKSVNDEKRTVWNYLFFVGIGLGLLGKGPMVLVHTVPPIVLWIIIFREYGRSFRSLPWLTGTLLTIAVAVPWYWLAEKATPGFLNYFIVGEHFTRFIEPNWKGDMYGVPKHQPLGIMWVYLIVVALPWVIAVIGRLWKNRSTFLKDKWIMFLLLWILWTPLFFTVSSNQHHTYLLPVMAPVALLAAHFWDEIKRKNTLAMTSFIFPFVVLVVFFFGVAGNNFEHWSNTDKYLIKNHNGSRDMDLYYLNKKSYSSQFYSRGKVQNLPQDSLSSRLDNPEPFKIIILDRQLQKVSNENLSRLRKIDSNYNRGLYEPKQ